MQQKFLLENESLELRRDAKKMKDGRRDFNHGEEDRGGCQCISPEKRQNLKLSECKRRWENGDFESF